MPKPELSVVIASQVGDPQSIYSIIKVNDTNGRIRILYRMRHKYMKYHSVCMYSWFFT